MVSVTLEVLRKLLDIQCYFNFVIFFYFIFVQNKQQLRALSSGQNSDIGTPPPGGSLHSGATCTNCLCSVALYLFCITFNLKGLLIRVISGADSSVHEKERELSSLYWDLSEYPDHKDPYQAELISSSLL